MQGDTLVPWYVVSKVHINSGLCFVLFNTSTMYYYLVYIWYHGTRYPGMYYCCVLLLICITTNHQYVLLCITPINIVLVCISMYYYCMHYNVLLLLYVLPCIAYYSSVYYCWYIATRYVVQQYHVFLLKCTTMYCYAPPEERTPLELLHPTSR